MEWQTLAAALFPLGHSITGRDDFLCGAARVGAGRGGRRLRRLGEPLHRVPPLQRVHAPEPGTTWTSCAAAAG